MENILQQIDSKEGMSTTEKEDIYVLNSRDATESRRLNRQHHLLSIYTDGTLIYPSIPKEKLESIVDVATGTGIWLQETAALLSTIPTTSGVKRIYTGFDISPKQFPDNPAPNVTFSVQDILKPYPKECQGKYDLVYVRLLCLALKEDQLKTAVTNVLSLLKPGGWIQWDDYYFDSFTYSKPETAELKPVRGHINDHAARLGLSSRLPTVIQDLFQKAHLDNVTMRKYATLESKEKIAVAKELRMMANAAIVPGALLKAGKARDETEGKQTTAELGEILQKHYDEGWEPVLPLTTVLGRVRC